MKLTELIEAIDLLRKEGWTVEPPRRRGTAASSLKRPKRVGRPPKNGRRKRGRPRKHEKVIAE
jgi:hypothetical protein